MGKKGPMNGELNSSSPTTDSSPSQDSTGDKTTMDTKDTTDTTAPDDNKEKAKPFDINDFFLSDTVLSFSGGVSSFMPKC